MGNMQETKLSSTTELIRPPPHNALYIRLREPKFGLRIELTLKYIRVIYCGDPALMITQFLHVNYIRILITGLSLVYEHHGHRCQS